MKLFKRHLKHSSAIALASILLASCNGSGPSTLLRSGDVPTSTFPMYMSDLNGIVWKINQDGTKSQYVTGLQDPKGVTTDRFKNLYVIEAGLNRLLKISTVKSEDTVNTSDCSLDSKSACQVIELEALGPANVAVDSLGEIYVSYDNTNEIVRSDGEIVGQYNSTPSSLTFGVNDIMIVSLVNENKIVWGDNEAEADIYQPVGVSIDGTGRVYGIPSPGGGAFSNCEDHFTGDGAIYSDARTNIVRYWQTEADEANPCGNVVSRGVTAPVAVTVDAVGNVFVASQSYTRADGSITRGIIFFPFIGESKEFVLDTSFGIPRGLTFTKQ